MINFLFLFAVISTIFAFIYVGTPTGDSLTIIPQVCISILFLIAIFTSNFVQKLPWVLRLWFICLILALVFAYIVPSYAQKIAFRDCRELFIPFAITFSSYQLLHFTTKQLNYSIIFVGILSVIVGLIILLKTGGFEIFTYYRLETCKNQTSPFFAQIGLLALTVFIGNSPKFIKFLAILIAIGCLSYCVILRARTASLCFVFFSFVLLLNKYKFKAIVLMPVIAFIIYGLYSDFLIRIFEESVVGHTNVSDINSFTSGRTMRMHDSWFFIVEHFFTGASNLSDFVDNSAFSENFPIPHVYLLWKLLKYGAIFGLPYIIMYFSVLIQLIKEYKLNWFYFRTTIMCVGLAYLTSFAEYSAPFGPGTAFLVSYILFGVSLRASNDKILLKSGGTK